MDIWEARVTKITIDDEQKTQLFESIFLQRIETEPDLKPVVETYGPSLHAPPA